MPANPSAELSALDSPSLQAEFTDWSTDGQGERVGTSYFRLEGLYCGGCAGVIEQALCSEPGVVVADVSYASQRARVQWQPRLTRPSHLVHAVQRAGYRASADVAEGNRALRTRVQRAALWRLFVAGFCTMQVMMYAAPAYVAAPGALTPDLLRLLGWASWLLSIPVLAFAATPIFQDAFAGLKRRQVRMDLPVALGLSIIFVASMGAVFTPGGVFGSEPYFDSLTMFVFFLLLGRWLTMKAQHRVTEALENAFSRLSPPVRRIEADGSSAWVSPRELKLGDHVRTLAGEAFAADGAVIEGRTEADEALLTGESRPTPKLPGDHVLAGSINMTAPVTMLVERVGADTRLEGVVALMRNALTQRPQLLAMADRIAVPFLWTVLALSALAGTAWWFIEPSRAVWVAVSVLIVTCPCALSLAAPSTLLAAAGALARRGILVRRLDAFEPLARLDKIFFDKTGTLTDGAMTLQRIQLLPAAACAKLDEGAVLRLAGALAAHSNHPVSVALAREVSAPDAVWTDVVEVPGMGLQASAWDGSTARLGSRAWVDGHAEAASQAGGRLWFGDARGAIATFDFNELVKPDARASLDALRRDGLSVEMLSGDDPSRVAAIASELGMTAARGALQPDAKLACVVAAQSEGHCVGMVGDGINDAPIVARADVSFAFAQGAGITQSSADFILLSGNVGDVAYARDIAKRAMRVLKQNLAWAAVYNAVCVPLALLGCLPPWAAGIGMATSSLWVVLNALRLLAR